MKYDLVIFLLIILLVLFSFNFIFKGIYYESRYYKENKIELEENKLGMFLYYFSYLCLIIADYGLFYNYLKSSSEVKK